MSAGTSSRKRQASPAISLVAPEGDSDRGMVGRVDHAELKQAVAAVSFPVIAWDQSGQIRLANEAAAELVGRRLDEVVGKSLTDFAAPANEVNRTIADLSQGRFVGVHSHRTLHVEGGPDRSVLTTSRAIEVDGQRGGVSAFVVDGETAGLGRDPTRTWLDLVPVAVGVTDMDWVIQNVSTEIRELIDQTPAQVRGRNLLSLVNPEDIEDVVALCGEIEEPHSFPRMRFMLPDGGEIGLCVLVAPLPAPSKGRAFGLVGRVESFFPQQTDRVADLELRLRRIGAEVRAAELMTTAAGPALQNHPEFGDLSTRQWEILNKLQAGDRVPTIAKELFISQSTVRNHLSTIFQHFGVHSQAELLERLRQPLGDQP